MDAAATRATSKSTYGAPRLHVDLAEVDAQSIVRYSEAARTTHALHQFDLVELAHRSVVDGVLAKIASDLGSGPAVEKRLNHGLREDAPRRNDCHRPTARH
jgi:hypothetical protein